MPAMVEAGAISGLLRHLASSTEGPPPSSQQAEVDQQSPSLLLAARLLYAFSLDPGVRCVQQFSRLRSVVWVFKPLVQHSFHLPRSARGFPLFYCCERTYGGIFPGACICVDCTTCIRTIRGGVFITPKVKEDRMRQAKS